MQNMYIIGEIVSWGQWLIIKPEKKIKFKKQYDIVPLIGDCVKINYSKIAKFKSDDFVGKRARIAVKVRDNIFPDSTSVTLLAYDINLFW